MYNGHRQADCATRKERPRVWVTGRTPIRKVVRLLKNTQALQSHHMEKMSCPIPSLGCYSFYSVHYLQRKSHNQNNGNLRAAKTAFQVIKESVKQYLIHAFVLPSCTSSIAVVLALHFSQPLTWLFPVTKLSQNNYENASGLFIMFHLFPIHEGNFQAAAVAPSLIPAATCKV